MATAAPCPRCYGLWKSGFNMPIEMVQPLRGGARDALAHDGSGKCCADCAAADALKSMTGLPEWHMARIAIGNDRMEALRLPGVQLGTGLLPPTSEGDLDAHHDWLAKIEPGWMDDGQVQI